MSEHSGKDFSSTCFGWRELHVIAITTFWIITKDVPWVPWVKPKVQNLTKDCALGYISVGAGTEYTK